MKRITSYTRVYNSKYYGQFQNINLEKHKILEVKMLVSKTFFNTILPQIFFVLRDWCSEIDRNILSFRHEKDFVRWIETLIPLPNISRISCSHLRDKAKFRTIIELTMLSLPKIFEGNNAISKDKVKQLTHNFLTMQGILRIVWVFTPQKAGVPTTVEHLKFNFNEVRADVTR